MTDTDTDTGSEAGERTLPLAGVRVLDMTNVLAGPYAGYQLALMGADVVKVEVPGSGDLARQLGASAELNGRGLGASFLAQNAGKRSLTLDLKTPGGRETMTRLVRRSDVLLENFRPGVLERLGFGWKDLSAVNPGLVYCAVSGFGSDGPLSGRPAYDQIIQGLSGMMSTTGTPGTGPLRAGFPIADVLGGLAAAFAISTALVRRERTGRGSSVDVSMLETAITAMGWGVSNYLSAGVEPVPIGNENATAAPRAPSPPPTARSTSPPTSRSSSRRCARSWARPNWRATPASPSARTARPTARPSARPWRSTWAPGPPWSGSASWPGSGSPPPAC